MCWAVQQINTLLQDCRHPLSPPKHKLSAAKLCYSLSVFCCTSRNASAVSFSGFCNSNPYEKVWLMLCECEHLAVIDIKLPAPHKLSRGPFRSDGCWLGSEAPGLQIWFEDCFHLLLETQGQIRSRLFFVGIQKAPPTPPYRCIAHNFPVQLFPFILVPAARYVYMHTQSYATWQKMPQIVFACSKAIPFKREKRCWEWLVLKPL